jgi:hypothetical protein
LWAAVGRRAPRVPFRWQVVELPDGDFVELAWVDRAVPAGSPTAVVLHGLAGSAHSGHVRGVLSALSEAGFRAGCLHFRGCGRGPNRTPLGYHSGKSDDPRAVIAGIEGPVVVVGFSLGANVLLKMLGEDGASSCVRAAVAVSPPLVLAKCADRMEQGFSQVYQAHLLRGLRRWVRSKSPMPVDPGALRRAATFRQFDDLVTAPIHGFRDASDYYARASSRPFLPHIRVPTLILHDPADPFFSPEVVPEPHELPPGVTLHLGTGGGHVGFVEGSAPWKTRYWVEEVAVPWLAEQVRSGFTAGS